MTETAPERHHFVIDSITEISGLAGKTRRMKAHCTLHADEAVDRLTLKSDDEIQAELEAANA